MNLPTKLTVLRILLIPVFVTIFFIESIPYNYLISAVVFLLASLTDFLDGYLARKNNQVTDLGKFLDPIADKVLVSTALIIMLTPIGIQILPWYGSVFVAVILARELIVSGFRMVASSKGKVLAADKSGKIKTFVQDVAIIWLLVGASFFTGLYNWFNLTGIILLGIATLLTIYSGVECIVKNKDVLKG